MEDHYLDLAGARVLIGIAMATGDREDATRIRPGDRHVGAECREIAELIQRQWKETLGIDIGLQNQEWNAYQAAERKLDYSIDRAAWTGDYVDPNTFLDMWVTDGGNNRTGWSNAHFDELIRAAPDQDVALRLVSLADRLYDRAIPVAVSGAPLAAIFTDEMVRGGYRKKYLRAVSRLIALSRDVSRA